MHSGDSKVKVLEILMNNKIAIYFSDRENPKDKSGQFVQRSKDIMRYDVSKYVDSVRKLYDSRTGQTVCYVTWNGV